MKKTSWVKIAAIATAIVGAVLAVVAFIKNKSKRLNEELDFDNSLYFDEDLSMMDDDLIHDDVSEESSVEEEKQTTSFSSTTEADDLQDDDKVAEK